MRNAILNLIFFFFAIPGFVIAQENLATYDGGGIRVDNQENIRVDGNIYNEGNVRVETDAIIYLHGDEWSNHTLSSLGIGDVPGNGWVYFVKDASSITGASVQILDGNNPGAKGTGSSFPRIKILNVDNVQLVDNGTRVRAQVDFAVDDGHIITNFENVYMSSTANFTQFTELRYVVTNGTPTTGGFVRKENLNGSFIYPIGSSELDYTPATLTNSGTADCYDGRVFFNTFLDGVSGGSWNPQTVARTWKFEEETAGGSNVIVDLQHNTPTNGGFYDPLKAYVANYIGTVGNTNGGAASPNKWDLVTCPNTKSDVSPGTMTTGASIAQGVMLDRTFTDLKNYPLFTKKSNEDPTAMATMSPDDCDGSGTGSAMATGAQGITPYTYQWSANANGQTTQTATGLTAGTYTVSVYDVAGCLDVATIVVTQNAAISLSVSGSNATCNTGGDGTATATAVGGTPPLQYTWSANANSQTTATASGLTAGTYMVSVTDATGCMQVQSVMINEPAAITVSFTSANVTCESTNNGSATATPAQGTAPFTYAWSANANGQTTQTASGLAAGTYMVSITDTNGCTAVDNITINQNPNITLTVSGANASCYSEEDGTAIASPSGGTPPLQYTWSANANGQTTATASGLTAGTYMVSVTDATGCMQTQSITITEPDAIAVVFSVSNVSCDSTANGSATVMNDGGNGQFTYQWDVSAGNQSTSVATDLAAGTYQVTLTDATGCSIVAGVMVSLDDCDPCPSDFCKEVLILNTNICVLLASDPTHPLANLDCDGDGVTNATECTDSTDPLDPCDFVDASITLPVIADQSTCPGPCPDLTPTMTILPGNIAGMSPVGVAVQVTELETVDTDGAIIIRIPSDPRFVFTWDPTLTQAALVPILNSEWNYLGDNGFVHTWTYNGPGVVLPGGGVAGFGFEAIYDPQATDGQTTLTATILPFSGGECNILNNTDSERLVYFQ